MDPNAILSYSTPAAARPGAEARPSPVLELVYAHFFLSSRRSVDGARRDLPWLTALRTSHEELLREIAEGHGDEEGVRGGYDLFLMAAEYGFVDAPEPAPFLQELPQLPGRLVTVVRGRAGDAPSDEQRRLLESLEALQEPGAAEALVDRLGRLWAALEPEWRSRGEAAVREACAIFEAKFEEDRDVLAALPAHHFVQFEAQVQKIRESLEQGRIRVVPLYFAVAGGFNFDLQAGHFIGYGLHSEDLFEQAASRVGELAARAKAFSDPTRLMLLALISRFERFTLTVGDLARQLGVSQPTVSGHLKVLREAGLLTLEKKGNRSYYHHDPEALRELLRCVEREVLNP